MVLFTASGNIIGMQPCIGIIAFSFYMLPSTSLHTIYSTDAFSFFFIYIYIYIYIVEEKKKKKKKTSRRREEGTGGGANPLLHIDGDDDLTLSSLPGECLGSVFGKLSLEITCFSST